MRYEINITLDVRMQRRIRRALGCVSIRYAVEIPEIPEPERVLVHQMAGGGREEVFHHDGAFYVRRQALPGSRRSNFGVYIRDADLEGRRYINQHIGPYVVAPSGPFYRIHEPTILFWGEQTGLSIVKPTYGSIGLAYTDEVPDSFRPRMDEVLRRLRIEKPEVFLYDQQADPSDEASVTRLHLLRHTYTLEFLEQPHPGEGELRRVVDEYVRVARLQVTDPVPPTRTQPRSNPPVPDEWALSIEFLSTDNPAAIPNAALAAPAQPALAEVAPTISSSEEETFSL